MTFLVTPYMGLACVCRCYVDIDLIWLRIATDSAPSIVGFLFNLCAYTWAIRKARSVHRRAVSGGGTFYHGADPARLQLVERVVSNASKCTSWWLHGVGSLHNHMERAGRAGPLPLTPLCCLGCRWLLDCVLLPTNSTDLLVYLVCWSTAVIEDVYFLMNRTPPPSWAWAIMASLFFAQVGWWVLHRLQAGVGC